VADIAPANWTPLCRRDLTLEVGFLPDVGVANYLAQRVAEREAWRRDSVNVVMPIPDEWLIAGCPALRRCHLHDGDWQMDGLILSMQEGEAKFAFTAARINRAGVSVTRMRTDLTIRAHPRTEIVSVLRPVPVSTAITVRVPGVPQPGGGGGGEGNPT
jgi:hypothetical protein